MLEPKPDGIGLASPLVDETIEVGCVGVDLTVIAFDFSESVLILSDFSFLILGFGMGGGTSIGADSKVL